MSKSSRWVALGCLFAGLAALACLVIAVAAVALLLRVRGFEIESGPGVAVLDVAGEIRDEEGILERLEQLTADSNVKALVVRVDSPGGEIAAIEEVYNGLKRVAEEGTPVVASMGSTAASGGYFVCLPAQRIFANRSSLTGSIGVMVEFSSAQELFDALGIRFDSIKSGEFKGMGAWNQPLTEHQREHMQTVINDFHQFFVETVAAARRLDLEKVRTLADGRVFTGRQALEAGLVDELGDLDRAVHYAAGLAGLEGKPRIIRARERRFSLFDFLNEFTASALGRAGHRGPKPQFLMR